MIEPFMLRNYGAKCVVLALFSLLVGCQSNGSVTDGLMLTNADVAKRPTTGAIAADAGGAIAADAGAADAHKSSYPSLGAPLTAAAAQMTTEEAAAMGDELNRLAGDDTVKTNDTAYKLQVDEMRDLAANHDKNLIREIEKPQ